MQTSRVFNIVSIVLFFACFVTSDLQAQQKPTEIYNFNFQKFNEYPSFLFISIDSIFYKENVIRPTFKKFVWPFINEFKEEKDIDRFHYNLYLSLGLYETDTDTLNHISNVKKVEILYRYLVRMAKSDKRISNSLNYQEDFTKIDRHEYFEDPPQVNCITFNFRRLATNRPKVK